ncbi:ABC transporter permease [Variovorax arabinosiphilus]|uniref:ABC transporter permease n=1 Tax=Variovorax arabinosiphilus TaxID=3053498 RepID=UPI0025778BFE|nr:MULTISPECIES: ABC transporter permease [unclassified Variovorax]MDM0119778.1 ABC transporter permease [Variovorax sp. J2L1-78]MDM0128310.1 ABC transporter permease [Variovorax sp. J2L1-63]MDM0232010.1 ABC transporter permease [Variovorax sp. J2R1-6]
MDPVVNAAHADAERPPLIALRGIRKRYGGTKGRPEVEVLHGIDLDIRQGEFVAIVGTSGSGKSTLMNLLGCLDRPSDGTYRFDGRDVAGFDADELAWLRREAFGFVFQGYHLIATESARENVEVPAIYAGATEAERAERAAALLTRLGLPDKLDHRPNQLSGGQQQRVSIARALMNGGRIILADEPTGALDSKSGAEVMALLRELADAGHTVIVITHDREVAAQARRVIELRDGAIVGDSAPGGADRSSGTTLPPLDMAAADRAGGASFGADLREAARTAWRGMRLNRARTGLTLLGIVIGVASVIVMLAIGEGARQRVVAQMGTMGTAILYLGSSPPKSGGPAGQLTAEDLDAVAELPAIRRVMPVIGDPITVRHGRVDRQVYVFAASEQMPLVHQWRVALGRYYTDAEDRDLAPLVVLGHKAHQHFFPDHPNPLGQQLLIGNSPFEVIGVMAERGTESGAQSYDDMVFIPYRAGRARVYLVQTQPDYVVVEAASSGQVDAAETAMKTVLTARHGREDFAISNAGARLQAEAATRQSMTVMLGLIAAVSLVVGGIGVMNVMLMTVRERTREIGIRMATGARQRDIQRQFMTEAVLLTVTGGGVGVTLGIAIGAALIVAQVPVVLSVGAMLGAFLCAVATGLVFGYMPAKTAARLDPVVALSGEG